MVHSTMQLSIYVFFLPCVFAIPFENDLDWVILRQRYPKTLKNWFAKTKVDLSRHHIRPLGNYYRKLESDAETSREVLKDLNNAKKRFLFDISNRKTNFPEHERMTRWMDRTVVDNTDFERFDLKNLNPTLDTKSKYDEFKRLSPGLRHLENVKTLKAMSWKDHANHVVDQSATVSPSPDLMENEHHQHLTKPIKTEFKGKQNSTAKKTLVDNKISSKKKALKKVLQKLNKEVKQKSFQNVSLERQKHGYESLPTDKNIGFDVTRAQSKTHLSPADEQNILDFIYNSLSTVGDTEDVVKQDHHMWTADIFGEDSANKDPIQKRGDDDAMGMSMSMNSEKDNGNMDNMDMDKMKRLMEGYKYHVMLDMKSKLMLCWNVFYENKTVSFRITCQLPPDYWFGVGFAGYGEVTNADFVVFWNDPVKTHHLQDSWTDDKGALHSDKSQDYYLNKARTEHGLSILEFSRPFDSCDDHDYLLDNGTTHVVYFTSKGTPSSCIGKDVRQLRHGFQRVQLLKPDVNLPSLPSDVWTFDITAPKVHVPGVETTYWWYITTLPKLNHKQHIVRYEGIIQKENEGIVHHIEVFHCFGNNPVKPYSGPKVPEGKMDPNSDLARCKNVMGAWAMGAEPIIYPEEAGSPIGGKDFSHYVLLEVHFHNPHLQTGHVDSSGIRFYVTPTLRQYDMGIMELGLEYTDKMVIPPGEDRFTLSGYCIADCTQMALPKDGINIFASQLHTHLTGKRVWTKHVRNGLELPEVNRDNHYSPHFQEVRVLRRPINILPGDALITECEDSTVDRRNVTFGGFSITEEMCVNYIHYYPKVNLEVCKSSISYDSLYNFFYFMKRMESVDIMINEGIKYNYNSIPWLPINVHLLDYVYQTSPISMQCNQSDGHRFPGNWEGVPVTKIDVPFKDHDDSCS